MSKIKSKKVGKLSRTADTQPKRVSFRFDRITTNKNYNFNYFKDKSEKLKSLAALFEKLQILTSKSLPDLTLERKISGCETIPINNFKENARRAFMNSDIVSSDSSLVIFRFASQKYRIICKTAIDDNSILYILGFDFDFSAYNHG